MKLQRIMWHPKCNARAYEASGSRTTYDAKWNLQRVPNNDNNVAVDGVEQDTVCNVKQWTIVRIQNMVDNQNVEIATEDQNDYEGSD